MEQIPKIVTHSLRQMAPGNAHPDADLLTAFAERSLPDAERAGVLKHLSACADCREVVALATPALEPAQAVLRPSWIRGAAFRWAALAACMVVVGTAVTLYQRHEPPSRLATYNDNTPEPSTSAATVEPAPPQSNSESKPATKADAMLSKAQPAAASPAADLAQARSQSPRRAQFAPSAKVAAAQPATTPAQASAASTSAAAAPRSDARYSNDQIALEAGSAPAPSIAAVSEADKAAPGKAKDQPSALEKQTLARSSGNAGGVLVDKLSAKEESAQDLDRKKAEPAPESSAAVNAVASQMPFSPTTQSERLATYGAALAPRFTISAAGKLARSFDQGKTWLPVPVDGKSTFRAISANASDVWAAGNGGALFHSVDAGDHWAQVKPVIGGAALTADIVRIVARDAKHLQLSTADHQLWSTSDGGATWQLQ